MQTNLTDLRLFADSSNTRTTFGISKVWWTTKAVKQPRYIRIKRSKFSTRYRACSTRWIFK